MIYRFRFYLMCAELRKGVLQLQTPLAWHFMGWRYVLTGKTVLLKGWKKYQP